MPRDLFAAIVHRPPSARPFRRGTVTVSVLGHIVVISVFLVAQVFAVGPLPQPRQPAGFEWVPVRLADIELPPPAPPSRPVPRQIATASTSPDAAPLFAPTGVQQETGLEDLRRSIVVGTVAVDDLRTEIGGDQVAPPPPPVSPQQPVRLHSGIKAPVKTVDVHPDYPTLARQARVEGVVIVEATIGVTGDVESARILRSIPLLDQAAVNAVRQWKFTPALLNGVAVPVIITVTVNFALR